MNIIEPLKEFFGYDVPLGVCIIVALGAYHFVFKLQEERWKDGKIMRRPLAVKLRLLKSSIK